MQIKRVRMFTTDSIRDRLNIFYCILVWIFASIVHIFWDYLVQSIYSTPHAYMEHSLDGRKWVNLFNIVINFRNNRLLTKRVGTYEWRLFELGLQSVYLCLGFSFSGYCRWVERDLIYNSRLLNEFEIFKLFEYLCGVGCVFQ